MSWNYRIVKNQKGSKTGSQELSFEIHEVYYDDKGNIESWTENPCSPYGETLEELKQDLKHMFKAFEEPVLEFTDSTKMKLTDPC